MRSISPNILIPSSITPISSSFILLIVTGTPSCELKLFGVLNTLRSESASATISLVVVFPTLPVIPTSGSESLLLRYVPRSCSALVVFSTSTTLKSGFKKMSFLELTAALHPAAYTASKNLCASFRSPTTGTKRLFLFASLESITIFENTASSLPEIRTPPVAAISSLTLVSFIHLLQAFFYNFSVKEMMSHSVYLLIVLMSLTYYRNNITGL